MPKISPELLSVLRCPVTGSPLVGAVPEGAGTLGPAEFATVARHSLSCELGGEWHSPGS